MTSKARSVLLYASLTGVALAGCGSMSGGRSSGTPVTEAWTSPPAAPAALPADAPRASTAGGPTVANLPATAARGAPIVRINGSPLSRGRFVEVLLRGHGLALLEGLVVLESAKQLAADRKIVVAPEEVDRAYGDALRRLAGPGPTTQAAEQRQALGERLLHDFLRKKNVSLLEYMLGIERTVYLERLVAPDVTVTEADLRIEFARRYGPKVQVRHIQVATLEQVKTVRAALAAGTPFETVARRHSHNAETAANGGLLPPFTRDDSDVPQLFAMTAFALEPQDVSPPIQDVSGYHFLTLERRFPASDIEFRHVADALRESARRRLIEPEVARLAERLFQDARVEIFDDGLRAQYEDKHGSLPRTRF